MMQNASLRLKLLSIVAIFAVGEAVYIGIVSASMKERVEHSDYRSVMAFRDLIADILPPPMYVLEAYSIAMELAASTDPAVQRELIERFEKLEADRNDRELFWTENAERLEIDAMLPMIKGPVATTGRAVFSIGSEQLIPAVREGDHTRTETALAALRRAYYTHRRAIDQLVAKSYAGTKAAEEEASTTVSTRKKVLVGLGALIVLLGGVAATLLAQSVVRRAKVLGDLLQEVAEGNLTQRAVVDSRDELGHMAKQLNVTLQAVERAFRQVRNAARALARAAPELAHSSNEISGGAQQQAANLEETAASLEEITAAVKQSANNAQQASKLALGSRDVAEQGGRVVGEAVHAMNEIRTSSRRIEEIITTIDEVALQTKLLALNAAVEAARAGELGRGFAVVAAEVGNLAQRSAAAAKEVKALIEDSLQRVENGHELVDQSGKSLQEIILSVKKVTDVVGEIAAAAREQSVGVDQVNQAIGQMDQVTQVNAAQTQNLTRTADELSSTSQQLLDMVERFKLTDSAEPLAMFVPNRPGSRDPNVDGRITQLPVLPANNDNLAGSGKLTADGADFEVL